ncbi:photosystem II biogenesis protein Psp29 [Oxynema sp. CENA135]|uniref:photosystem II biogenesis protein Psp29 n=1 Tax=Oxynema sp. CENA135 TaxID=984206 RepID=UPI001F44FB2A|nr:photosystem II biogenesis protein Psp29 [Oxynema sp. CENA135]
MGFTSPLNIPPVNNVRTVSDTKRAFYSTHTRPINSIYRRVVEELMVEMHLLSVNTDFHYDPIYALGVVTSFDRFMQGYRPERDREGIFNALCHSIEADPQQYRSDAQRILDSTRELSDTEILGVLKRSEGNDRTQELQQLLSEISSNPKFKYSRLFGIGLFTLLEQTQANALKDAKQREELFSAIAAALSLPEEKIKKDVELYQSNLEKMTQARSVMEDIIAADRKKREQRAQQQKQKDAVATPPSSSDEGSSES